LLLLLDDFRAVFSQQRVFARVCRQALGVLCALGSRTVARVLAATGRDQCDWTSEYRVFSRSPWQTRELFFSVIRRALAFAGPDKEPIVLAGDFTHLAKSGRHIPGVHCLRDPLSPPFHTNLIYGLRFFQVTVLCPFRNRQQQPLPARSVPVRFEASPVLSKPGKKATQQQLAQYRSLLKARLSSVAARQVLEELRQDFDRAGASSRPLLVALDGSFCNQVFFKKAISGVELLCRCRKDAVLWQLHQPAADYKGPKRFYDPRCFSPDAIRQDETIPWQSGSFFHGGAFHTIRYKELKRVFWRKGAGRRPLRLIVIAPTGYRLHHQGRLLYRQPAFLLSTDRHSPLQELIAAYLERWQIEINHREEKSTLGLGDAQVRNPLSVPRQPALVVAVYAMLLLAALRAYGPQRTSDYLPPPKWGRPALRPSLLDIISLLRKQCQENPQALEPFAIEASALDLVLKAAA
jgi:DDE superfamily endonuclease